MHLCLCKVYSGATSDDRANVTTTIKSRYYAYGLLALLTILPFLPALNCGFVAYDDQVYVYENLQLQRGLTWDNLQWCLSAVVCANWHPLTMLSLLVDYELAGLHAGWYHAVNLLLHTANVLLLFCFLDRTTRRTGLSFWVALLFAIHPLRAESVAWISERKDVLCGLFWMLTLLAYVRYCHGQTVRRYLLVAVGFACALLSKPMAVTLPFALLLVDLWPLQRLTLAPPLTRTSLFRQAWPLVREKLPLFLLAAAMSVATYLIQAGAGAVRDAERIGFASRLLDSIANYGLYIVKTFYPVNLAVFYGLFGEIISKPWIVFILIGLISFTLAAISRAPSQPWLLVGWCWYLGTLVPVIGIVQIGAQSFAERYSYLPSIGLCILTVWGTAALTDHLASRVDQARATALQRLILAAAAASVAILAFQTYLQTNAWQNSVTLFANAVETNPRHAHAFALLGEALVNAGQFAAAKECVEKAVELKPADDSVRMSKAFVHARLDEFQAAVEEYQKACQIAPTNPDALRGLGQCLLKSGQTDEALRTFLRALAITPDSAVCHGNLALIYACHRESRFRNGIRALKHARAACEATANRDARALGALGAAYAECGRFDEALTAATAALPLAAASGQDTLAAKLQEQLAFYQARRPWRQDFAVAK